MIFNFLRDNLSLEASTLLDSALASSALLEEKRISLVPLFGVSADEIDVVKTLLKIKYLENLLSSNRPYYTLMEKDIADVTFSGQWISLPGGRNVHDLSLQEFTNGNVSPDDELVFSQILKLLPPQFNLILRGL